MSTAHDGAVGAAVRGGAMLTCPWCGQTEGNEWLLGNNHWVQWGPLRRWEYDWCRDHGMCIAMDLTRNHVIAYARQLRGLWPNDRCACGVHKKRDADCVRAHLARAIARAEEVWPSTRGDWLDEYRPLTTPPEPPEHHAVADSEQDELFAAVVESLGGAA